MTATPRTELAATSASALARERVLETPRLRLRPWHDGDAALLGRLAGDARVVRHIGDRERWPAERVALVARDAVEHWRVRGFGWRVAIEKGTGAEIGLAALNRATHSTVGLEADELEIGWWLVPAAWGRGFASEAARAVCGEAFAHLRGRSVCARIQPANTASVRVARAIGMRHGFDARGQFGERVAVYRMLAGEWADLIG